MLTVVVEGSGRVVSNPAGIDCDSATCSAIFPDGTNVALAETPAAGSTFGGWGAGCSGLGACFFALRADTQVFAHFDKKPPGQVHLSASVTGPGQVTGGGLTCGNGASTCDLALAAGTSVSLTAAAAPQARFTGWGGGCSGNAPSCQITLQADTRVTATFELEIQTLVPNDGTNRGALAINSTSVFYARDLPDGASVWSVPKAGGAPMLVASGRAAPANGHHMVADDAFVYWTDTFALFSAPVQGGPVSVLATPSRIGALALDEGALYWIIPPSGTTTGSVHRMQNRIDVVIATNEANWGIAVDSTHAYFTSGSLDPSAPGAIRRVPKLGGTVETLVNTSTTVLTVRVDSQNVYYRDSNGSVWGAAKSGGPPHLVSTGNAGRSGSDELDVNAFVAWWIWNGGFGGQPGLYRANADGTGWTAVETSSDSTWFGPRVDDTAVYYFHGGTLIKRLK